MTRKPFNPFEPSESVEKMIKHMERESRSFSGILVLLGIGILLFVLALPADANELRGEVVGITDGDTLTVVDKSFQQYKIRLAGIDAPERKQPYGNVSRQYLGDICFRKEVRVTWEKQDRYGRIIGKVYCNSEDAGLNLIRKGLAWWYRQYSREQSPDDQDRYADAEQRAKTSRQGLWNEPAPTAPWDWRKNK